MSEQGVGVGVKCEIGGGVLGTFIGSRPARTHIVFASQISDTNTMSSLGSTWDYANSGPGDLYLWIEPWAEGYDLTVGARVKLVSPKGIAIGELEETEDQITIWSSAPLLQVFIDGELQESASACVPVPLELSKAMLGIMFGNYPEARLGGRPRQNEPRVSWWKRLARQLGR